MSSIKKRAICAALACAFMPAAALAESPETVSRPAIAAGLNIPIGASALARTPVPSMGRAVLVDAASAQLFMIENGQVVDSMKVIVGKPQAATPTLKSTLFYATVNPYWNVPADLARTIIAPHVLEQGLSYLKDRGYEVVSNFGDDAEILPASSVDWKAVAAGRATVSVRQRPGPANSMGQMKFGFDNNDGIYLHDTPRKELFASADRNLSNGCVRLEDAPRLARWLLGRDPSVASSAPEQHLPLPGGVPIVITYLDPMARSQVAALH